MTKKQLPKDDYKPSDLGKILHDWKKMYPHTDPFADPAYDADCRHWVQMRHWTPHEAVTLSLGKDPNKVSRDRITSLRSDSDPEDSFTVMYTRRFQILDTYLFGLKTRTQVEPGRFVRWAREKRWNLPKELAPLGVKKRKRKVKEPADVLADNQTWRHLERAARKTIEAYPEWCGDKQQPAQAIIKWIEETRKVTLREAEIIKKVLNDWLEKSS